jgi:S-methylmethionine-dependent homocysteine/selenocysteine methylase
MTEAIRLLVDNVLMTLSASCREVLAAMFNCCEPEAVTIALGRIRADQDLCRRLKKSKVLLGGYANRLSAIDPNWSLKASQAPQPFRQDLDPQHYWNDFAKLWTAEFEVKVVGGCCGITPEHISYLRDRLRG